MNNFANGMPDQETVAGLSLSTGEQGQEQVLVGFQLSTDAPKKEFDTPLEDFWGTGCGYMVKGGVGKNSRPWQRVYFNFIGMEVLASSEPYPHPTASISLFYSDPENAYKRRPGDGMNDWEAWCEPMRAMGLAGMAGFNKLFGGQVMGEGQQPPQPGLRMHVKRVPTPIQVGPADEATLAEVAQTGNKAEYDRLRKWHAETKMVLRIVEVEGVGAWSPPPEEVALVATLETVETAAMQQPVAAAVASTTPAVMTSPVVDIVSYVLDLANGKTLNQFYQAAVDDVTVMNNPMLQPQILSRTYHENMVNLGRLKQDGELLTRVS